MATRVPAWKRLGLQLKPGGAQSASTTLRDGDSSTPIPSQRILSSSTPSALGKRKQPDGSSAPASEQRAKFARRQDGFTSTRKSVSFSSAARAPPDPSKKGSLRNTSSSSTSSSADAAAKTAKPKKPKQEKELPRDPPKLGASFEYLRRWRDSRDSWKFNKNHQTLLIKYIFHEDAVPASELDTFYRYIRHLQGSIRPRLRDTATEVRNSDIAAKAKAFADGVKNADGKQEKYEEIINDYTQPTGQAKHYAEPEFLAQGIDKFIARRVVRRMRAERILQELAESQHQDTTTPAMTKAGSGEAAEDAGADVKRIGRKTARPRNSRQAAGDESSSSSDDSTSEESGTDEENGNEDDGEGSSDSSSSSDSSDDDDTGDSTDETSCGSPSSSEAEEDGEDESESSDES